MASIDISWLVYDPLPVVVLEDQVQWQNLDLNQVMKWAFLWELIYKSSHRIINSGVFDANDCNDKFKNLGASYVTAFLNAIVCTTLGTYHLVNLWGAPDKKRYVMAQHAYDPWYSDTESARYSAYAFIGWLLCDIIHVLLNFGPKQLGGWDTVVHHAVFATLVSTCVGYGICPFAAAWLFCGELSSLPLNVRFFLINTGHGPPSAMTAANVLFAATFFLTRVALYWFGLFDYMRSGPRQLVAHGTPTLLVLGISFLLVFGAALNLFWFTQIVQIAIGRPRKQKSDKSAQPPPTQEAATRAKQD